jgi:hypothetical protein
LGNLGIGCGLRIDIWFKERSGESGADEQSPYQGDPLDLFGHDLGGAKQPTTVR